MNKSHGNQEKWINKFWCGWKIDKKSRIQCTYAFINHNSSNKRMIENESQRTLKIWNFIWHQLWKLSLKKYYYYYHCKCIHAHIHKYTNYIETVKVHPIKHTNTHTHFVYNIGKQRKRTNYILGSHWSNIYKKNEIKLVQCQMHIITKIIIENQIFSRLNMVQKKNKFQWNCLLWLWSNE